MPNRYGHFELGWKRAHGFTVKLSEDWYGDLLALPPARVSKVFRGIYRDCVVTAALLRAAAQIGRVPGTGGTSGVDFLVIALFRRAFPALWTSGLGGAAARAGLEVAIG